ncbi:MFS transporter [Streptomyces sp. NBC_00656]|uniref:MFS transporter n=1 Tax=Streptomyces sp. NBC_00656 TaxID=2903668 RepID=UPI00324A826F
MSRTAIPESTHPRVGRPSAGSRARAWFVVGLLVCFMIVNYADKVAIGLAGVDIIDELGLTKSQFGLVQSSFFWLLALGSVLGGLALGRIKARWLLGSMVLVWVISIAPLTGTTSLSLLIACRVLLGFAEGPATGIATAVTHSWFPPDKRAVPTSIVIAGASMGPLIASPTLTWVMLEYSWHTAFAVLCVVGLAWVLTWLFAGAEGPETGRPAQAASAVPAGIPYRKIFFTPTFLGLLVFFFTTYWCTAVKVSWLPLYLRDGLGYSAAETGNLTALPYAAGAVLQVGVGVISAGLTRRGVSSRAARCLLACGLAGTGGLCTIGFSLMGRGAVHLALMIMGISLIGAGYGAAFSAVSDIVPARRRGGVMGVIVGVYSLGGIVAPLLLGGLVDSAGTPADGYSRGFMVIGGLVIVGAVIAALTTDPERDARRLREYAG